MIYSRKAETELEIMPVNTGLTSWLKIYYKPTFSISLFLQYDYSFLNYFISKAGTQDNRKYTSMHP